MKIFFTSDIHYAHGIRKTPDGEVIEQINRTVGKQDRLYFLGDIGFHGIDNFMNDLVCKDVHLIYGNHDKKSYVRWFRTAQDVLDLKLLGHRVFLSHYPHAFWPASHHGSLHLYGHCHDQREETLDTIWPERRSMDVGIDTAVRLLGAARPFAAQEILDRLLPRVGHDSVEFYDQLRSAGKGTMLI